MASLADPDPIVEMTARERECLAGYLTIRAGGVEHRPGGLIDLSEGEGHEKAPEDVARTRDMSRPFRASELERLVDAAANVPERWNQAGWGVVEFTQQMRARCAEVRRRARLSPTARDREDDRAARWARLQTAIRPWRHVLLLAILATTVMVRIGHYDLAATMFFLALTIWLAHAMYMAEWKKKVDDSRNQYHWEAPEPTRSESERYAQGLVMLYATACVIILLIAIIARSGVFFGNEDWNYGW